MSRCREIYSRSEVPFPRQRNAEKSEKRGRVELVQQDGHIEVSAMPGAVYSLLAQKQDDAVTYPLARPSAPSPIL